MDKSPALVSAIIWRANQDNEFIHGRMMDVEVWLVCQGWGGKRLADSIERWLKKVGGGSDV